MNRELGVRLNGNFDLLRHVGGEGEVNADINVSFPLDRLTERENFLSLLHYFGLLSIRSATRGRARLGIPNQTVRRLLYAHLRDGWKDASAFSADVYEFSNLVVAMAYEGAWRPVVDYLANAIATQTGIRDYIDGERVAHAFPAAHFSIVGHFLIHSERELNKGYADLHLEPFLARYPDIPYGYVIELKVPEARPGRGRSRRIREAPSGRRSNCGNTSTTRACGSASRPSGMWGSRWLFHGWELVASDAVDATRP